MSHQLVIDLSRQAIMTALMIAAPMLLIALGVGLVVSIIQSVTQIQEQTLAFVPKLVLVGGAFIVGLPWLLQILIHEPQQLATIASKTPHWVWGLLAGLLTLGASQLLARRVARSRVAVTPLAMTLFSFFGMLSGFKGSAHLGIAITLWTAACVCCMALMLWHTTRAPTGTRYDARTGMFNLPGSAVPLTLIIGIFLTKYVAGIELAIQADLVHDTQFVWSLASLYGMFSGAFLARGWRLWRLAHTESSITGSTMQSPI